MAVSKLVDAARAAREHAVADFSGFKVGAAVETADGRIIAGCNIENASYGLTICAERVAIFKALSEGHREFKHIATNTMGELLMATPALSDGRMYVRSASSLFAIGK